VFSLLNLCWMLHLFGPRRPAVGRMCTGRYELGQCVARVFRGLSRVETESVIGISPRRKGVGDLPRYYFKDRVTRFRCVPLEVGSFHSNILLLASTAKRGKSHMTLSYCSPVAAVGKLPFRGDYQRMWWPSSKRPCGFGNTAFGCAEVRFEAFVVAVVHPITNRKTKSNPASTRASLFRRESLCRGSMFMLVSCR